MKKTVIFLVAILLISAVLFSFAGCGSGFTKDSIRLQIEGNLGWHMGGTETTTYEIFNAGSVKLGEYTSARSLLNGASVAVTTSTDSVSPKLDNFKGYKFTSEMRAELDDETAEAVGYKVMEKVTESYASLSLEPKLSYVKITKDGKTEEIVTSYESKKCYVTFIVDGEVATDNAKYSSSAFVVDNSYLYQYARATTLSSALTLVVPTYNVESGKVQNNSFTCSYASASNANLKNQFVVEKSFSETIASGNVSGESPSGSVDTGYYEASGDIKYSEADESGNVTATYPMVLTNSIPVVRCTIATTNTFPASGSISCLIATAKIKMQGDKNLVSRVVVRFEEDGITYNLTGVKFTM